MCKVSNKLKLCTCKTEDVSKLKHYWILKRPSDSDYQLVGEMIMPANIGVEGHKYNSDSLKKIINGKNPFDVNLQHQENDILEFHFTCVPNREKTPDDWGHGNFLVYAFTFKNGNWKKIEYDPFIESNTIVQKGKILHPF